MIVNDVRCSLSPLKLFIVLLTLFDSSLQQKKTCTNPNGTVGTCTSIHYCRSLMNTIRREPLTADDRKFLVQSKCSDGTGPQPLVCCTSEEQFTDAGDRTKNEGDTTATSKPVPQSEDELWKEVNRLHDGTKLPQTPKCGRAPLGNRIYNGKDANLGEFPWMVLLNYRKKSGEIIPNCAGSLINSRYILTAAHCLTGDILKKVGPLVSIRLGEHDLTKEIDCEDQESRDSCADPVIEVEYEEIIPHENFDDTTVHRHNDIGLIRLKNYVNYTTYISPVCLPSQFSKFQRTIANESLVVAGWGRTKSAGKSDIKQKLTIPVVSQEECAAKFAGRKVNVIDGQLCAGGVFYEDACDGDSGGPLMKQDSVTWIQEAVVSFGYKCGLEGWPAIYTRITSYDDWIKSKLKP